MVATRASIKKWRTPRDANVIVKDCRMKASH
jgi:hypothetical protein